ncbi:MAG TPA: hypothetical protein VM163_06685 [bacterium]|nr:hypothetical protein [bacterium]
MTPFAGRFSTPIAIEAEPPACFSTRVASSIALLTSAPRLIRQGNIRSRLALTFKLQTDILSIGEYLITVLGAKP